MVNAAGVAFNNYQLETAVRYKLSKTTGDITYQDLKTIDSLSLYNVYSLKGIENLTNIVSLEVYYSPYLKDFSSLKALKNLNNVCIKNGTIENLSTLTNNLSSAKDLSILTVSDCKVKNIAGIEKFSNIVQLDLYGNQINDITALKNLKNMISLNLSYNQINSITSLRKMNNLVSLNLGSNRISSISTLSNLTNLKTLNLSNNLISNFNPVNKLNKLQNGYYYGNKVSPPTSNSSALKVYINNSQLNLDTSPIITDEIIFLPVIPISQELGATVNWDSSKNNIVIKKGAQTISLTIGSDIANVDGNLCEIDAAPVISNGVPLVPARFLCNSFDAGLRWNTYQNSIYITVQQSSLKLYSNMYFSTISSQLKSIAPIVMDYPSFEYYKKSSVPDKKVNNVNLKLVSIDTDYMDTYSNDFSSNWFSRNKAPVANYEVPNLANGVKGDIPNGIPIRYKNEILISAMYSSDNIFLVYGSTMAKGHYLIAVDPTKKTVKYVLDFKNYSNVSNSSTNQNKSSYSSYNYYDPDSYKYESIKWVNEENGILYISHCSSSYSPVTESLNGYITAIDLSNYKVLWRTDPLTSNSNNFEISGDYILSGCGFYNDVSYIYILNKYTGKVVKKAYISNKPLNILKKDNNIYVVSYNSTYLFEMK